MLRLAHPRSGRGLPPESGADRSRRPRRPRRSDGWEARALLAAAGALYIAAAELAPFDRVDAWIDARFFWEPIAAVAVALLVVATIEAHRERRRSTGDLGASSPQPRSELVPICMRCKAVHEENDCWEPIERYLAYRTPDKFTRSLCPACFERLVR